MDQFLIAISRDPDTERRTHPFDKNDIERASDPCSGEKARDSPGNRGGLAATPGSNSLSDRIELSQGKVVTVCEGYPMSVNAPSEIRLESVRISNFRALQNVEVLVGDLTVLIGSNNAGKTSFLEALALALSPVRRSLAPRRRTFDPARVDRAQQPYDYY